MPRYLNRISKQQGIAALVVTLLITLIATVATVYASRNSLISQKASDNSYQATVAAQAAENGMNDFIIQIQADMTELAKSTPNNALIKILKKAAPPAAAAAGCALSGSATSQYELKNPTQYFTGSITPVNAISGVDQKSAYRVNAEFAADGTLNIKSEGCVGNADTGANICSNDELAKSTLRKSIKTSTAIDPGNNAITLKNNIDARSTLNISAFDTTKKPSCGVMYGSGGQSACTPSQANQYCLSMASSTMSDTQTTSAKNTNLSTMNNDDYFKSFFGGMSKTEVKAEATKNGSVLAGCPGGSISTGKKIIWIEGDVSGSCTFNDSDAFVIVNGNVTGQVAALSGAFIYANNVFQNGAINVVGSVAVEGTWDVAGLGSTIPVGSLGAGRPFTAIVNNIDDGINPDHAAQAYDGTAGGALTISYKKIRYESPPESGTSTRTGSWIDF